MPRDTPQAESSYTQSGWSFPIAPWRESPTDAERCQINRGRPPRQEIRQDRSDRRREFEAESRAGTGDEDARRVGVAADHEVAVYHVGREANRRALVGAAELRQMAPQD